MFVRKIPPLSILVVSVCLAAFCMPRSVSICPGATAAKTAPALSAASQPSAPPATVHEGLLRVQGQYPILPKMTLWLPGSMAWPNLRGIPFEYPPSTPCTFKTVELSNAYLTARFVPDIGFRLYDLTWNDDPLKRQAFRVMENLEVDHMWRWEGPGYLVTLGAMKWGFPYHGHVTSDHVPWSVRQGVDEAGDAWAEGTYADPDTGIIGMVKAVLPKDAARLTFTFTCRNPRSQRQGLDYWIDSYVPTDRHIEFAMPASEAISHQKGWGLLRQMFFSWPIQGGKDRRFYKDWDGGQGVFPADLGGDYTAFYSHRRQTGVVRIFPHEKVLGVKFWMPGGTGDWLGEMFGGLDITQDERRYLAGGQTISWQETWYPVRQLKGFDAGNEDVAFRVAADKDTARLYLTATRVLNSAQVCVQGLPGPSKGDLATGSAPKMLNESHVSLQPGATARIDLPMLDMQHFAKLRVKVDGCKPLVWEESVDLLKPEYTDENLDKDRQAYTKSLRSLQDKAAATVPAEAQTENTLPVPPPGFVFRHAGTIGADPGNLLKVPNACCRLSDGGIAVADQNRIKVFKNGLIFDRSLKTAGLRWPLGLCARANTLYVADTGNSRIVCIDLASEAIVRTIELPDQPAGIASWRDGLAVALTRASKVVYLDLSQEQPTPQRLAGSDRVRTPFGVTADGDRLLVTDPGEQTIVAIARDGRSTEVASARQGLSIPSRVAVLDKNVYVLDAGRSQMLRLDADGGPAQVCLNGRLFGPISLGLPGDIVTEGHDLIVTTADPASICRVSGGGLVVARYERRARVWPNLQRGFQAFCRQPNGNWIVTDLQGISWFGPDGRLINQYASWGRGDGQVWEANAVACDSRGYVYVSDFFNFRVMRFDPRLQQMANLDMDSIGTDGVPESSRWYVRGLAVDSADHLAVAVCGGQGIHIYSSAPRNQLLAVLKPYDRFRPMALAFDAKGTLFVVDDAAAKVLVYSPKDLAAALATDKPGTAPVGLTPATWNLPRDSCALSVAPDEKGGCYVTSGAKAATIGNEQMGSIIHLDPAGQVDRTISSMYAMLPRQVRLDGDHLLVANGSNRSKPGISAVRLDGQADSQANGKTMLAYPEPPTDPGMFRSVAGIMRIGGPAGRLELIDSERKIKATIDPATLTVGKEEPFDTPLDFFNPSPDGTMVLHKWRGDRFLWDAKDGHLTRLVLGDLKNPACIIHDPRGGWWATVHEPNRRQVAFFAEDREKPVWTVSCLDGGSLGDISCFVPLPDGNAWAADCGRHQLVVLSRKDGSILKTTPEGVVHTPKWLCALKDGSILVTDETWGLLRVSADGRHSWKALQDQPEGHIWEVYYDEPSGRLFYPIDRADSACVGWAEPVQSK